MSEPTPRILVEGGPAHRRLKLVLAGVIGAIIGLAGGFTFTTFRLHDVDVRAGRAIDRNCEAVGTLANIERQFIGRQERQTQALLSSGFTFGIPKKQLAQLLKASRNSEALFLSELDTLTENTCRGTSAARSPIATPHRLRHRELQGIPPIVRGVVPGKPPPGLAGRARGILGPPPQPKEHL